MLKNVEANDMTIFATFAEINKPVCKLTDFRQEMGRDGYNRSEFVTNAYEVWAIVKYFHS